MTETQLRRVLVLTGMSGAGRSTVAHALEDSGWYVVDNLPPALLMDLVQASDARKVAVVVDVRTGKYFDDLSSAIKELRGAGVNYRMLFLDASDQALVQRFESTRRPHPLQGSGRIVDGITKERVSAITRAVGLGDCDCPRRQAALNAAVSGEVQITINATGRTLPMIKAGKVRALATVGDQPSAFIPGMRSVVELGYDVNLGNWIGMLTPAGTPFGMPDPAGLQAEVDAYDAAGVYADAGKPSTDGLVDATVLAGIYDTSGKVIWPN